MATPTIVVGTEPTVIDNAEAITNWGGDTFTLEPDIKVQGSNSVACTQTNNGTNDVYVTGTWDFSGTGEGDQHLRLWMNSSIVAPYAATETNNGVQIFLYDGTNTAYWTVAGSDTYGGGWRQFVVYTGDTATSGTVNKAAITRIGIRINTIAKPRNVTNGWYDAWTYGDGYTLTGGTSSDPITWTDIAALDAVSAYGIVSEIDGVIFLAGDISIGNGATATYLEDTGDVLVYKDLPVLSTLYSITFQGSGCDIDISGGVLSAAGTQTHTFDASDTNLNSFTMTGKQMSKSDGVSFAAGETITNCVFANCLQVVPSTSTFQNNTISASTDTGGALLFPSDDSNISDLQFIANLYGVEYDATSDASSPAFDNFVFDDIGSPNFDVNNTSGSAVTISVVNTPSGAANSYLPGVGSPDVKEVTFSNDVQVTFTGMKDNTEVRVMAAGSVTNELAGIEDATSGTTDDRSFSFTLAAGTNVDYRIGNKFYEIVEVYGYTIPSTITSIAVQQVFDRNYYNP